MGLFGSIGSIAGGVIGSYFGPVGTTVGAGLGNALGGAIDGPSAQEKAYAEQMALARSSDAFNRAYVQNQLQWRVADAKKAGLHPMAVLGMTSPQYSGPSLPSISGLSSDSSIDPMEFGQSLNYASAKAKDRQQQQSMVDLQIEGLKLDNEMKRAQIDQTNVDTLAASIASNQGLQGPAAPRVNLTDPTPMQTTPHVETGKEPASNPAVGWITNPDGSVINTQSGQAKNKLEEDLVGTVLWNVNNRLVPHIKHMFGADISEHFPPVSLLPKGAAGWMYSGAGEYLPVDSNGKLLVKRPDLFKNAKSPRMKQWFRNLSKATY